jgi:hypothetical protein
MSALVVLFALGVDVHRVDGASGAASATARVRPILRLASGQLGRDLFIPATLSLLTHVPARH